ncbi:metal-sulfur cluster assembly factor [Erythrobacter sp. NE805]|uniref:metal-sulfur cluster assembly factor n=1 Tax=Erythrobacter sp. NE805 TaxID=3389875 RepID=UPI00396B09BB
MLAGDVIEDEVRAVLARIHDPCSVAAGRPVSVLDMGLVRGWTLHGGTLTVTFCVTFAGCTMAPHFAQAAERDLAGLLGVERVVTVIDTDFVWTPELMQAAAVPMRGRPQAWRERVAP